MLVFVYRWPKVADGSVVSALVTRLKSPRFNFQPVQYQITTLGKLFTPLCLCGCKWSSG